MSSVVDADTIERSARVLAGHTGAVVVQLRYDGTLPPTEVLTELRRRGWRDAHPSPPPAQAIDWSSPDAERGLRYSLLPFQGVTSASFDGTAEERSAAATWVRSVLERSGFAPEAPAVEPHQPTVEAPTRTVGPVGPTVCFELAVADGAAPGVRSAVLGSVEIIDEWPDTVVTEVTFRGNRSDSVEPVVRFVVEVAADAEHDFLATLSGYRVVDVRRR